MHKDWEAIDQASGGRGRWHVAKRIIANGMKANFSALNVRSASVDSKFSTVPEEARLAETIERPGECGSRSKLTGTQEFDDDRRDMSTALVSELEDLSGTPLRQEIT